MEVKSFKQMRVVRIGGQLSAGLLFILLALSTVPFSFGSNNVEAETNSSVPSTITLTAANANATVTINPSDAGTFGTTSGNANIRFTITTSNSSGYTLTAKSSKTTLDRSGSGQLLSLASAVSQSQFSNASNTTLNNRWGYKPNYYNSSSNNNYRPAPSTSGVVLDKTTVANPTAKSYTIALGARINYDVPAGSYVNDTLELQYVANPVPYTITFDNNAPDDIVTNMPTNLTGSSSSPETITLPSRVPQRTNYTFVGWCTVQPTEVAGGQSCSGTTYSTSSQYGLDYTANNSSNTLYAIWTSSRGCNKAATTIGTGVTATDAVCMQDINDTVIASMTANAQHTLIDMRDGKSYFITKLVDGKVWMTQNLNYNLNTSTTLTHNNTDLGYETNDETKTWTPSRATLTNVANWSDDTSIPMSYDAGSWYYTSSGTTSADTASQVCSDSSTCCHFNAGTYYNWLAAIAENETNSNDHEMVPDSVCPAGWRLQDAYDEITYGELNYIFFQRGYVDEFVNSGNASLQSGALNAMRSAPLYIVRASRVTNGAISSNGTFASYWARTTKDSNSSYAPYINNTTMYAISSTNKGIGTSVRCIARMTTGTTSVAFHGNGATSGVDFTVTTDSGRAVSLHHTDSFVKPGYKITSWNTKADGSGNTYLDTSAMIVPATDTSTLNLFAQWEPSYNITYNGNGANSALTMTVGHNVLDGDNITLYAPNYFRTGYGFAGWSTTQINPDASNAATLMANAKIFGPNQTITANYETFGVNVPTSVTLYAVWVKSSGNMQDWKGCESLTATTREGDAFTPGSIIALTDTRDGDTYAIARLADGNCWMIENFRLDSTNSSDASKAQHFGDYFVGLANPEDIFTSDTTANSLYSTSNITGENIASRIPRYSNNNTNTTGQSASGAALTPDPSNSSIYHQWYGYGNMYNWPAAIADASDVGSTFTGIGTMTSICPSGWMLPVSSSTVTVDYSFMKLLNSVTGTSHTQLTASTNPTAATISSRFRTYPYNYVGSGYQSNSQVTGRGTNTYLWESASGTNHQYAAMFYVSPASVSGLSVLRTVGAAIRCVADKDYRIIYDGNGADAGHDMRITTPVSSGSPVTLAASNYVRSGYGFAGWSTTQINPDASNASTLIANATIYGPNESVTFENVTGNIKLYAVWIKPAGNLQDWSGCSSLAQGSVTALKDTRDNQVYTVAKLADGECWMIENLRLNDDHSADYSKMQGVGGVFSGLGDSTTNFGTSATTTVVIPSNTSLYTAYPRNTDLQYISGDYQQHRFPKYNNQNTALTVDHMMSLSQNVYSYGNYYNWPAAMANTSIMNTSNFSEYAGSSLCPAGWRLPTGGTAASGKDYNTLVTALNVPTNDSTNLRKYPNNFIYSGIYSSSNAQSQGTTGVYASSSANNDSSYYSLNFYDTSTQHSSTVATRQKVVGTVIRCIKDDRMEVILDANDGSGRFERVYGDSGFATSIPLAVAFMNDDSVVTSWNTKPDGSGTSYTTAYSGGTSTTLYAQWTSSYKIIYDGNNATSIPTMNAYGHSGIASGAKVLLYASNVLRDGYGFVGWSYTQIDPDSANAATQIANAKILGPNETITANATTLGVDAPATVTLYAVWIKPSGNLQSWNGCESLTATTYSNGVITPGGVIGLTDTRDNKVYAVARLSDGNCWIIDNLRLLGSNTNVSADTTNHPTNDYISKIGSSYNWCYTNSADCFERILYTWSTTPLSASYYNWYTATAGNGTYSTSTGIVAGDICPKGWHLPNALLNSTSDYFKLAVSLGGSYATMTGTTGSLISERLRAYPNNFGYYGYGYSTANTPNIYNLRQYGYYAGANAYSQNQFSALYIGDNLVITSQYYKYYGTSVRCVKNPKTVYYDGNGADNPSAMGITYPATAGSTVTLSPSNYKRSGYGFLGWSYTQIDPDSANAATQIANATIYGPNETITLPSSIPGDLVIYAVWAKSAGNMQDWTGCSSLADGGVTALKDTRDNQVYAVAKLADGNCWMIENLRLDSANSTDNTKAQGFGGVFAGLPNSELASFNSSMIANSLYTTDTASSSLNIIAGGDNLQYRIPRFNDASSGSISTLTANTQVAYSYGNYYNFAAIKANTGEMDTTATSEWSGTSICPKGWRLPTGGASGSGKEYESLNTAANSGSTTSSAGIRSYPNNFIYSGYIWSGAASARGQYGQYMSGSSNGGTGFFEYQFTSSAVNVGRSVFRSIGDSVRCIAKTGVTITLDSNDGSDKVAHVYVASGTAVTLSDVLFENENHSIASWNTSPSGTGTSYTTTITASSDVTLYAQWIPAYTIVYNGNNATGTTNMNLSRHTGVVDGDSIMLFSNNYIRDGYGFLGWSTTQIDPDASNASTLISNAKIWGPNQTIVANSTNLGVSTPANVTLYAVWVKATGTFQNWKGCSSLTTTTYNSSTGTITPGSFVALTDTRGTTANTYAIARLPGGNCWMIEDARFDLANDNITKLNTNNPTDTFLTNMRNTPSTCTSTAQSCVESTIYSEGNGLSRGIYYGWWTATAGNGAYNSNNSYDSDICPTGWHIPNGGSSASEFATLLSNIGASNANYTSTSSPTSMVLSARLRSFPLNFQYSGDTQGSNIYSYREQGYYNVGNGWANGSTYYRYYFGLSEDFVRVTYGWSKYMGFRLRCVYAPLIKYDGNGATSGSMTTVSRLATGASVTLRTSNFEKTGYGFLGWSPVADGSGPIYGQNETISASELSSHADAVGNVTMYAIWVQSTGNLQNWSGCDSLTKPTVNGVMTAKENVTALTDTRDNRTYTVARLADGNCYMNENLRLGASEISTDLTSGNTNVSTTVTAATFNGWRTTAATATATAGFVYTGFSNYEKNTINYNYCAATAGTICVDSTTESATYDICPAGWRLSTGGYMSGDIAGLYNLGYNTSALARKSVVNGGLGLTMNANVGASDISAQYLTSAAASASVYAPYLTSSVFSGTYQVSRSYHGPVRCVYDKPRVNLTVSYGSGVSSVTVNGSSVPSGRALRLDQGSTVTVVMYLKEDYAFNSWNTSGGTLGVSAQTTTFTLGTGTSASITGYASFTGTYIQNMSDTLCTTTARKVYDSRDMQSYYVKRLSDGNCWMVTNLNLGAVNFYNNLTSANSNLSTTVTYSTFNGWKKTASASTYTDGEFMVLTGNDATTGTPYGTLYNYYAATGGTISGDSNSTNATYDICPAGWRLPTGGNGNYEYYNLYNYYNSYSLMRASYNNGGAAFNQPGWFGGGASSTSNVNLGLSGSFWSSTTYNYNYRYGMYVATSGSTVQRDAPMIRNGGHSIRCIKKPDGVTLNVNYSRGVTAVYVNGNYIANGSSANVALGNSVSIIAYVKDGYSFYGWTVGKGSISSSSAYSTTYTAPSSSVTTTLNADARFLGTTIQGMPASYCTSTPRTVYDNRDDQAYTVARLKDGRCWMIDDLRLGYNTIYTDLTSTNTNLSSTITAATFSSWKNQAGSVSSGGFTTPSTGTDPTSGRAYGVTYNYYAASAGTISGDSNSSNATYDICPVGWRLPTGVSTTGDFAKLFAVYNTYSLIKSPVTDGGAAMNDYNSSSGVSEYWSSSYSSPTNMNVTYVTPSYQYPSFNTQRQYKNTIRCVMKNDSYNISNLTYLQDWNSLSSTNKTNVLSSMYDSVLYHLKDNRDNQTYDVAKLKDGHIWITQNLNLGSANISVNLTSANTNIASTVTSSTFNSWRKSSITPTLTSGELMYVNGTDSTSGTPYGVMYNYCAASGGTYCSSSSTANASYDLCPAGWRMPTSGMGSSYDIYNFGLNYQTAAQMFGPVTSGGAAFTLAGRATGGNLISYSGTYGDYWSSNNSGSTTWMKTWNFNSSSVADAQASRGYAINVRCIGK